MKKMMLFIALGIGWGSSCIAYIYEIKVFRVWQEKHKRYITVIGCSDFHDKVHPMNQEQLEKLDKVFVAACPKKTKIVLEDLSSHGSNGRVSCGRFLINSRGGILGGLATKYSKRGFDVVNTEYRICRVCGMGPSLNNIHEKPHKFASVAAISLNSLAQEVDAVVDEIRSYDDGNHLQQCYTQGIAHVQPQLKAWKQEGSSVSVADYIDTCSTSKNRLDKLKHFLTFDSGLIDLRFMHTIMNAEPRHTHIIAILGGAHVSRVSDMLMERTKTQLVYETNVQFNREYDLNKCLGSTIQDGAYCIRPEPITNFEVINQYL